MRRLLLSLPIALIISIAIVPPCFVNADYFSPGTQSANTYHRTLSGPRDVSPAFSAADNSTGIPEGLTLAKGIPFITPVELDKGQIVTIKVKATNSSPVQITYQDPLKVNGKGAGSPTSITLEPSESKDITFLLTAEVEGSNSITVGNLQGVITVRGGSILDMFPLYVWIIFGVIVIILGMLLTLILLKPKKKAGTQPRQFSRQGKQPGKAGKPGGPDSFQQPGGFPRPGMPDGMAPGMPGQGQFGAPYDMQGQGTMGMQQPFQQQPQPGMQQPYPQPNAQGMNQPFPSQPGMPPPFPQQTQPGMAQQFPPPPGMPPPFHQQSQQGSGQPLPPQSQQGIPPAGMRPQYPQPPHLPQTGQQPPMHGMPPGMPQQMGQGMPHAPSNAPGAQPGMPFGMQPPPGPMAPVGQGMPPPVRMPGQPPMPAPMQPGVYPPAPGGVPPQMPGNYQSMGMMPKFSVSNLSITPNSVKVGEAVNISIYVTNNGTQTCKYSVVLRVGGVVENISDMTLSPGANQTASFVVVKDAPGDYYADIDGLGGFFNVIALNPPSFIVSNFSISPERVRQGQPIVITASVTNLGEIAGTHALILRVKGMAEAQQDVLLGPGKTQDVEFLISKDTPGFYPVSMENWTGKFVIEMDWTG
jgi:hypothetical protein